MKKTILLLCILSAFVQVGFADDIADRPLSFYTTNADTMPVVSEPASIADVVAPIAPVQSPTMRWLRSLANLNGSTIFDANSGEFGGALETEIALPIYWRASDGTLVERFPWIRGLVGGGALQTKKIVLLGAKLDILKFMDAVSSAKPASVLIAKNFIELRLGVYVGKVLTGPGIAYGFLADIVKKDFLK